MFIKTLGSILSTACCLILASPAQTAAKPNFSGTWILNLRESRLELGKDAPTASTFHIRHEEPHFHLRRTHVFSDGKSDTWGIDLVTDGKHEVIRDDGPNRDVTRMYWDNDVLVLDEKETAPDGSFGTNVVRYSLSPDGKKLTALEHEEYPGGKRTNRWVFDKQGKSQQRAPGYD
jgi:hypothetical protein